MNQNFKVINSINDLTILSLVVAILLRLKIVDRVKKSQNPFLICLTFKFY
jgi:hypothetical protein